MESQTATDKDQARSATKRSRRSPASKTKQDSPIAEFTSEKPLKFQTKAARLDAARKRQKKQMQNQPKKKTKANAGKLTLDTKIRALKCFLSFKTAGDINDTSKAGTQSARLLFAGFAMQTWLSWNAVYNVVHHSAWCW